MKSNLLLYYFLLLLYPLYGQENEAIILSTVEEIEFNNPYQFNIAIEEKLKTDKSPYKEQVALMAYLKKGAFQKCLEIYDKEFLEGIPPRLGDTALNNIELNYEVKSASTYVIEKSKKEQIVIINEAHHHPAHRIFTRSLLRELYDSGFRYLGLEALYNGPKGGTALGSSGSRLRDEKDSLLNSRGYPLFLSGNYLEPQMANLIRTALQIGFTVFSYEKTGVGSGNPREIGQAKNILEILKKDPTAKMILHCGYAHAYEGIDVYAKGGKSMAGWLKELSGIDPLTINQSTYSEAYSKAAYNHPLLSVFPYKKPKVLIDKNGSPMTFKQGNYFTDIAVIHPISTYQLKRPSWLFSGDAKRVMLKLPKVEMTFPLMVLVYAEGEAMDQAIPVDIVEVEETISTVPLALANGTYTVVLTDSNGTSKKFGIKVE